MGKYVIILAVVLGLAGSVFAWTTPVAVSELNTSASESWTFLSNDGLTLYFGRGEEYHFQQLYKATRTTTSGAFSNATAINELAYSGHVHSAWVSPDNLHMYYLRTEPGSLWKIKETTRATATSPWGSSSDLTSLNNLGDVGNPKLSADELSIVFTVYQNESVGSLYTASRSDRNSAFGNIRALSELNTADVRGQFLSADGLSLYFGRNDNGVWHNYQSIRPSVTSAFGTAQVLNFWPAGYGLGCFSSDGNTAYLGYNGDIYVSYIPEPATMALLGLGTIMLRRRK